MLAYGTVRAARPPVPAVRGRTIMMLLAGAALVAGSGLVLFNGDAPGTVTGALHSLGGAHWVVLPVVAGLVVLHFWFSAVALRGAAGHRLPLLHATMAQFTAATANRVTGGGLGTVAVNARYLSRHGTPVTRSVAVAGVLQLGGAIADLLLFALVIPIALATGGAVLLPQIGTYLGGLAGPLTIVVALVLVGAATVLWLLRDKLRDTVKDTLSACAEILRRPADLLVMLAASAATTLVMGVAFAVSMLAIPGAASPGRLGTLVAIYMLAAAAGGVVPGPGGLGSTEAALVALLTLTGTAAPLALSGVLIFRALTHWAPVPVGLLTSATLRKRERPTAAYHVARATACRTGT